MADYTMFWRAPVKLTWDWHAHDYVADETKLSQLPEGPGLYIFARKHGRKHSPIYVGYSSNLRKRVGRQLNNHRLMVAVQNADNGSRLILIAEPKAKSGQKAKKIAKTMEGFLIRKFHADGYVLLNNQGTARTAKTISWKGSTSLRELVPLNMQLG